jgi:hypothetical protein
MIGRHSILTCLLAAILLSTVAMAAPGQERTENVLTLHQAIELARANNRETSGPSSKSTSNGKPRPKLGHRCFPVLTRICSLQNF